MKLIPNLWFPKIKLPVHYQLKDALDALNLGSKASESKDNEQFGGFDPLEAGDFDNTDESYHDIYNYSSSSSWFEVRTNKCCGLRHYIPV